MTETTLFTIGFTKKTAEQFFGKLKRAGVQSESALSRPAVVSAEK